MDVYKQFRNSRMEVWIKIIADPHAKTRGFSILGRELRVLGYEPVHDTMEDFRGNRMPGKFWVVRASEVYRVIPEMGKFPIRDEAWFFPFEFCDSLIRPDYYLTSKIVEHTWL